MPESIHTRLEAERAASAPAAGTLATYRAYAAGTQRGTLTPAQARILAAVVGHPFADNVCKQVLLAAAGRLQLTRFDVAAPAVLAWLRDWWTRAQIGVLQGRVHWATLRDGDHAASLAWDAGRGLVTVARERWWDGQAGIFVAYSEADVPAYAVREWPTAAGRRRVVWWPDRIERYRADADGWQPYALPGEPWPVPWRTRAGAPLGLAVVHFANAYLPRDQADGDSSYGTSELAGGVLGLQDEINDLQRDITASGRLTAYQILTATGVSLAIDPATGEPIPLRWEPGTMLHSENPDAAFGALPAGDLSQLERGLNVKLAAISRQTATPLHRITGGDWPSGQALLQADKPLATKIALMAAVLGPPWASLAHKATAIATTFGDGALDTTSLISAVFADPADPDALARAQYAEIVAPFVSAAEVLRLLAYPPERARQILRERAADATAAPAPDATPPAATSANTLDLGPMIPAMAAALQGGTNGR